jgi:hypothetical protein
LLFILFCFWVNTLHTQFPDEFDNIFGGFLINHGSFPYTGFFSHHNPGAYVSASLITLFTGRSFVGFRIVFSVLLFLIFIGSAYLLHKRTKEPMGFFLWYGVYLVLGSTYWWGQMFLSETLVVYALVPVFLLIFIKNLKGIKFTQIDLWIISLLTFYSLFVSLTYIYLLPILILLFLFLYFRDNPIRKISAVIRPGLIFALPYTIYALFLAVTGGLYEFYFDSIYYNVTYYIYNFPMVAGTYSHHPARYMISIAKTSLETFIAILRQIPDFNLSYPMNISLGVGLLLVMIYLFIKRKFTLLAITIAMLFYTNARSNPLDIKETDFHATVYIMITLALTSYIFYRIWKEWDKGFTNVQRYIIGTLTLLTGFYWLFFAFFLLNTFSDKDYGKFMGRDTLIYDRPQTAPTMNKLLTSNDYYWIGPFELQELLFINGKVASKYFWFLPANSRDEKIKSEFTRDLLKNQPKVIVFKKWWTNFGVKPEDFNGTIVDILNERYFQISDLRKEGMNIKVLVGRERDFDFEAEYYFDKARKSEIVKELQDKHLIEIL